MDENERNQANRNWISTLNEARTNCREKVADAMVIVPNPSRLQWPVVPYKAMTKPHRAAISAHVAVIDFADQIRPYRDESAIEDLWTETLEDSETRVDVPEISLETLHEWEFCFVETEREGTDELHGEVKETQIRRVLLPPAAARSCYRQLTDAVKELGFAADADSTPRTEITDELMEEVEKWRKATLAE